jgi:excisionase family DNA binding protein
MNRFLKPAEIAELLGVTESHVYRLIEAGQIEATRVGLKGGAVRCSESAVERFVAARTTPAVARRGLRSTA